MRILQGGSAFFLSPSHARVEPGRKPRIPGYSAQKSDRTDVLAYPGSKPGMALRASCLVTHLEPNSRRWVLFAFSLCRGAESAKE